jgi:uncharacterized protein (TIGR00369 family)
MHPLNKDELILTYRNKNHFGSLIDATFEIIEPGIVCYRLVVKEKHLATPTSAHGGVIASLLDAATGVGALSLVCKDKKVVATVNLALSYLNGALKGDILTAESSLVKKGNRLLFMDAIVKNQNGKHIAKASATLSAYPMEKAGY